MNKESGVWLLKDELDYFNGSHRPDASAGVVSCNFATQLPKIKCQCALKQSSKFVPQAGEVDAVVSAKDHMTGKTEHVKDTVPVESRQLMPLLSQPDGELAESELDSQPPITPLTTNSIVDSHDAEIQHIDPFSKSNVQSQQLTPVFLRHISGELVLGVNLEQSSDHLMLLYAQKTKTNIECQYFVYRRKILEPHGSLMFYGVERDTTIHVCTRLLGGVMTIREFIRNHKKELLIEVILPNGSVSLKMTKARCLFLSTWLKCFTRAFADSKSWNGKFTLDDFEVQDGHVLVINSAENRVDSYCLRADFKQLVTHIKAIFYEDKSGLVSNFPPYLENLTNFLAKLKYPALLDADRFFIETHICCVESHARGMLLVKLRKKQKSTLKETEQRKWDNAMSRRAQGEEKGYVDFSKLSNTAVFDDIIAHALGRGEKYGSSKNSTFRLMRDGFMHGPSKRFDKTTWKEKFKNDDGIKLMIPAYNPNLVPDIIYNWINDQTTKIEPELLAAQVKCTCALCYPAPSAPKDGAESSASGKGKEPESPGPSQPSTPSSGQGSNVGATMRAPSSSAWGQPPQMRAPSQRQQPQAGASSRIDAQPAAPGPPSPAEPGWEKATRKGKGKR